MTLCRSCGMDPCRFQPILINKEKPVEKDEHEHTEIIGGAEVVVRSNETGLDTGDYSDVEVVAVIEDDDDADAALFAQGYRRRGVIVIGEPDLWNALGLDMTKAQMRNAVFDQSTMTWRVYLDSEELPMVAPYTEARAVDYHTALELFGIEGFTNLDWRKIAAKIASWVDEASGTNFMAALTDTEAEALEKAMEDLE